MCSIYVSVQCSFFFLRFERFFSAVLVFWSCNCGCVSNAKRETKLSVPKMVEIFCMRWIVYCMWQHYRSRLLDMMSMLFVMVLRLNFLVFELVAHRFSMMKNWWKWCEWERKSWKKRRKRKRERAKREESDDEAREINLHANNKIINM